jgi:hypothetical protein
MHQLWSVIILNASFAWYCFIQLSNEDELCSREVLINYFAYPDGNTYRLVYEPSCSVFFFCEDG